MGETEEDGAKPLRQPKKDGSQKPIRQAENEIPVFALFAILANMDPRTMSELIAKKKVGRRSTADLVAVRVAHRERVALPLQAARDLDNLPARVEARHRDEEERHLRVLLLLHHRGHVERSQVPAKVVNF